MMSSYPTQGNGQPQIYYSKNLSNILMPKLQVQIVNQPNPKFRFIDAQVDASFEDKEIDTKEVHI